ncbi:hypothetical protein JFL43_20405 [Viridibacillus sp. YIM B01967]|uniref:Uncharacterized protein n=1 Tax=Viridibacillus soli TaxID=2798301 RepID=A0ABS1HCL6_9BACL|nr:hypothetical protein [Viridibacillus soli]MBK3497149.1 hypothetical protein [Viridibacillus soli]
MKVVEINKLAVLDKERLLSHFNYFLMPFHDTRPVFQEVSEKKAKNGLCCVYCNTSNVVRFSTFEVKNGRRQKNKVVLEIPFIFLADSRRLNWYFSY